MAAILVVVVVVVGPQEENCHSADPAVIIKLNILMLDYVVRDAKVLV